MATDFDRAMCDVKWHCGDCVAAHIEGDCECEYCLNCLSGSVAIPCEDRCAVSGECECGGEGECEFAPHGVDDKGGVICLCSGCAEVRRVEYGCSHTDDLQQAMACYCVELALYR